MFLTICLNPVLQKTILLDNLSIDQVNRSDKYFLDIAGKGINVARILSQLGGNTTCLTQTGNNTRTVFNSLAKNEKFKLINIDSKSNVRYCYTLIDKLNSTTTEIVENGEKIREHTEEKIFDKYLKLLKTSEYVIISGTKSPGYKKNIYPKMVKHAKKLDKIVLLDFRGDDLINCLKYKPDFIKPNYKEFCSTFFKNEISFENKINKKIHQSVKEKMLDIYYTYNTNTILTNGKEEILYTDNGKVNSLKPKIIKPKNTIGSGDAFSAGFIYEYKKTGNIKKSVKFAAECSKKNALLIRPGTIY